MYQTVDSTHAKLKNPDAIVCPIFSEEKGIDPGEHGIDEESGETLSAAILRAECTGELGEVTPVYGRNGQRYLLWGMGKRGELTPAKLRTACWGLVKAMDRMEVSRVRISPGAVSPGVLDEDLFGRSVGEGCGLAAYTFDQFKATTKNGAKTRSLLLSTGRKAADEALADGLRRARCTNQARTLQGTPPNVATTTFVAAEARRIARQHANLACRVIQGRSLESQKLVGLLNVGKASENPPCLVELVYTPKGKPRKTVLLVGKTMCYDTGGLSLKTGNGMRGMKLDKSGGMAVLAAMAMIAERRPPVRVVGLLPTAENSISNNAYRPDDVLTYLNGVTVEVTNTDAEGRLILADALAYGCRKHRPDVIVDIATLTGGIVTALGTCCAGYFCEDEGLRNRLEEASAACGERIWRMPLFEEYREMMKSKVADIWNSANVRDAHPIQGAVFLSYFVDKGIPWAHIDIAGVDKYDKDVPPIAAGATGFGARLLVDLVERE